MEINDNHQLQMLEVLEAEPEISQSDLAARVGVAVGTVNWYLKRWSKKGFILVNRMGRWRWRYLLTPQGVAEKTRLTKKYLDASMRIYRQTRSTALTLIKEIQAADYDALIIEGQGEIAEICSLTCLEQGIEVAQAGPGLPQLQVRALQIELIWPEAHHDGGAE